MIRITRLRSTANGLGRSATGVNGERLSQSVRPIERFIAKRPFFCLAAALSAGITLGWWVKRR